MFIQVEPRLVNENIKKNSALSKQITMDNMDKIFRLYNKLLKALVRDNMYITKVNISKLTQLPILHIEFTSTDDEIDTIIRILSDPDDDMNHPIKIKNVGNVFVVPQKICINKNMRSIFKVFKYCNF